jgi:hypothetical protein
MSDEDANDPPRDPVMYLLWKAWRSLRPAPVLASIRLVEFAAVSNLSIPVDGTKTYRVEGVDAQGNAVAPPQPITFTSLDPAILRAVPSGDRVTIVGVAPGETALAVKAGELRTDLTVQVVSSAVSIRLVEVDPPTPA